MPRPRILLADDEAHVRLVLARRFEAVGCEVRMAADGEQGLAMARQEAPDLVITDVQMPHMSGLEFAMALRNEASCRDIPILMLTARNYIVQDAELVKARISHVLTKPFSIRKVVDLAHSMLPQLSQVMPTLPEVAAAAAAQSAARVRGEAA